MMASLDKVSLKLGFYGLWSKLMLTKKNLKEKNYVGQKHFNKSEICR